MKGKCRLGVNVALQFALNDSRAGAEAKGQTIHRKVTTTIMWLLRAGQALADGGRDLSPVY
jgi:hypothetical protein